MFERVLYGKCKESSKKYLGGVVQKYYFLSTKHSEISIIKREENIWNQAKLSPEQIGKIEKVYGKGCDTRWHKYYQYFTGNFAPYYLP